MSERLPLLLTAVMSLNACRKEDIKDVIVKNAPPTAKPYSDYSFTIELKRPLKGKHWFAPCGGDRFEQDVNVDRDTGVVRWKASGTHGIHRLCVSLRMDGVADNYEFSVNVSDGREAERQAQRRADETLVSVSRNILRTLAKALPAPSNVPTCKKAAPQQVLFASRLTELETSKLDDTVAVYTDRELSPAYALLEDAARYGWKDRLFDEAQTRDLRAFVSATEVVLLTGTRVDAVVNRSNRSYTPGAFVGRALVVDAKTGVATCSTPVRFGTPQTLSVDMLDLTWKGSNEANTQRAYQAIAHKFAEAARKAVAIRVAGHPTN